MDTEKFQSDILSSDLLESPATTLDELCDQYDNILSGIIDDHAPLRTQNITIRPFTPWYNDEINEAKKAKKEI